MSKILVILIAGLSLITTACNENEFSQKDKSSIFNNLDIDAADIDQTEEITKNEEQKESEKEIIEVIEEMIEEKEKDKEEISEDDKIEMVEVVEEIIEEKKDKNIEKERIKEIVEEVVEEKRADEVKKEIPVVIEEMEKEDVVDVKEPIKETIAQEELSVTYECGKGKGKGALNKLMVCHIPRGNAENAKTLCLPKQAIKAHVQGMHGNGAIGYMGPCKEDI